MLKSHEKFHSANGKRLILVVDDEAVNREMMGCILSNDYEIIYAEDGTTALELIKEKCRLLSLVLLDLIMPGLSGLELLREVGEDEETASVPIIVISGDLSSEIEALKLGASDFIQKPYPDAGIILARIRRTIELSEDRQIIRTTERDHLTGLYNKEYYYTYAQQYDQYHIDREMDAMVVDINHFHMINERYGKAYADDVLKRIGQKLKALVADSGGIVCRREADTFLVYCPHRNDYHRILEEVADDLAEEEHAVSRVRLRMGVYSNVDKSIDIERRFDRAKMAADSIRNSYSNAICLYDSAMNESEVFTEQLLEDFYEGMRQKQFKVYYQPKFNIRTEIPILVSAEALVRWEHPELGFISPGIFIPLFEDNGLIRELDTYVWKTAAAHIRKWKEKFCFSVPVSVNVSRVDMYDPNLISEILGILDENGLTPKDIFLEITESAYTEESEQIIEMVKQLRNLGFLIEMDDFGSGYSSLNMISELPIDALKLDMMFIRNAFKDNKDTRMLEVMFDIADNLNVPVIAEGVETEEQFRTLKEMGCDIVQGFYFSKPVPTAEYENFIHARQERGELEIPAAAERLKDNKAGEETEGFNRLFHALSGGFDCIFYVDVRTGFYVEFAADANEDDLQIKRNGQDFFADVKEDFRKDIHPEDRTRVKLSLEKDTLLHQLVGGRSFIMTYRRLIEGEPVYFNLKAVKAPQGDNSHIVLGISNVDDQIREALKTERALAMVDPLTGVRNKLGYTNLVESLDRQISEGTMNGFAIGVCDLNQLKEVNDSMGHAAGDDYIKQSCELICNIFKHSPVFRVGGDEFVIVMNGSDYRIREKLEQQFKHEADEALNGPDAIAAFGMSTFRPHEDTCVRQIFERADAAMYQNKKEIKERMAAEEGKEQPQ